MIKNFSLSVITAGGVALFLAIAAWMMGFYEPFDIYAPFKAMYYIFVIIQPCLYSAYSEERCKCD